MPSKRMRRRRAVVLLGGIGLGTVLAGCTDNSDGGADDDDDAGGGPY